jgi:hypothetical protein
MYIVTNDAGIIMPLRQAESPKDACQQFYDAIRKAEAVDKRWSGPVMLSGCMAPGVPTLCPAAVW